MDTNDFTTSLPCTDEDCTPEMRQKLFEMAQFFQQQQEKEKK